MDRRPEDLDFRRFRESGSPDALARVFDAVAPRLLLLAGHLARDAGEAEDLVQATFLTAMRDAASYDGERPVAGWLAGILRHRALDLRRRKGLRAAEPLGTDERTAVDPARLVEDRELYDEAVRAVEALPEPYRQVLLLRLVHGLAPTAIAHTLGEAPSTVRMRLQRGLERLRRALPDRSELLASLVLVPVRGLSAVRDAVLGEAAVATAAAGTTGASVAAWTIGWTGGWMGMKALVGIVVAVIAVVVLTRDGDDVPAAELAGPAEIDARGSLVAAGEDPPLDGAQTSPDRTSDHRSAAAPDDAGATLEQDATRELAVTVRFAEDGSPAPDVGVYVRIAGEIGHEARTDSAGRAVFGELAAGAHEVHLDRLWTVTDVDTRTRSEVTIEIPPGTTLTGRVVDLLGEGVGGARVYRVNEEHHDVLQQLALCAADGTFEVRGMADDDMELAARAAGFQPSEVNRARRRAEGQYMEFELGARGHSLSGRVVDENGDGVPRAWIAVGVDEDARDTMEGSTAVPGDGSRRKNMDREGILLRADAEGRFASDEVPAGHVVVIARPTAGTSGQIGWVDLWLTPAGAQGVVVNLRPGARVEGVVRDEHGNPVAGVKLEAEWEGTPLLGQMEDDMGPWVSDREIKSGSDGSFRLAGLLPGDYDLRAKGSGEELLQEERELATGEVFAWNPVIAAYGSLAVRLVDAAGSPLEGFAVAASERAGEPPIYRLFRSLTDADGELTLYYLRDDREHEVSVYAPSPTGTFHRLPIARRRMHVAGETSLEVRLTPDELPTGSITGRLVDEQGAPLALGRVLLARGDWNTSATVRTDAEGTFRFDALASGEYELCFDDPVADEPTRLGSWTLSKGETRDVGTLASN